MEPMRPSTAGESVDLTIHGMTCSACVKRIERALSRVDGVHTASVNFATERATVVIDPERTQDSVLVEAVERAGYQAEPPVRRRATATRTARSMAGSGGEPRDDAERRALVRDVWVASMATLPLLVLGMSHGAIPGADGSVGRAAQLVLASIVVLGPGKRFFRAAFIALRHRTSDMNTLVAIGTGAAYTYSTAAVLVPELFPHAAHGAEPHIYFEASGAILTFVLFGKYLESRAKRRLTDAVRALVALQPKIARRLVGSDGAFEDVDVDALAPGDLVLVRPGERIPADGEVVRGRSAVDESTVTGESMPVDKSDGSSVLGGTMNREGALTIRVERAPHDSALARIALAVEQAQGEKAPVARLADVVSSYFVPIVIAAASLALLGWLVLDASPDGISTAIERFVAVLVIACPCALGLATPAAVAVGTGRGAELGVLVKGGTALEEASRLDTVLLDKTGTLTAGKPELVDVVSVELDEPTLLSLAASPEQESEHPLAQAIVKGALARGARLWPTTEFTSVPGGGIAAEIGGRSVRIGTSAWLAEAAIDTSPLEGAAEEAAAKGGTPTFVSVDGRLAGMLVLADRASDDAKRAIAALQRLGIEVAMVTGDRERTARAVAKELGIERVIAEVRPEDKAAVVAAERRRGKRVAMVGDGVNDAPALAAADVGVAIGSGTDIALAAADMVLLRGGIDRLPSALRLARRALRTIRQNLFWAFVFNVVGIPLAAGVFYPFTGWLLSPVFASAAMSLSSISVLANSLRLRSFE